MPRDQYHGMGGSYTVDPDAQERVLVHRTVMPGEDELPAAAVASEEAAPAPGRKSKEK